jgi:hypothetical protein
MAQVIAAFNKSRVEFARKLVEAVSVKMDQRQRPRDDEVRQLGAQPLNKVPQSCWGF